MSYDKKFRERVLSHVDAGKTQAEVRKMFGLGEKYNQVMEEIA